MATKSEASLASRCFRWAYTEKHSPDGILGSTWAYFEILNLGPLFFKAAQNQPAARINFQQALFSMDCFVVLIIFFRIVRLAASVAIKNWQRTRPAS
jgi:EamA domain-containing membrane protein RarD